MTYRFLPHTADVIVEIEATSLANVFREATSVVSHLVAGDTNVDATESRAVSLTAQAADELLLRFIRELLTQFQLETFVPGKLEIEQVDQMLLEGAVLGEPFDESKHDPQPEVKAATRHGLSVEETTAGWRAVLVLDL
ncbi:MAG: archease [Gemmatimonadota bacterium]|nr:MAG: archease [Gemmatimonadota bacterium]